MLPSHDPRTLTLLFLAIRAGMAGARERAEIALLHRQPEDLNGARFALRALRTGLLEIATDLETR